MKATDRFGKISNVRLRGPMNHVSSQAKWKQQLRQHKSAQSYKATKAKRLAEERKNDNR